MNAFLSGEHEIQCQNDRGRENTCEDDRSRVNMNGTFVLRFIVPHQACTGHRACALTLSFRHSLKYSLL